MTNVDSDGRPSAHGIQCGMARMSIVASTGSPSQPRSSSVLQRPHRLVVAHVLVDGEHDAGPLAQLRRTSCASATVMRQRLLREDAA